MNKELILKYKEDLELWIPQKDEYCWFWNDLFKVPILAKLISIEQVFGRPTKYLVKTPDCITKCSHNYTSEMSFENCEPFIGELPSNLKDK